MKVEIWSDIACPFCYIGKRRFEEALEKFSQKNEVEVEWKSFQLDPSAETLPGVSIYENLAEKKGWTLEYTKEVSQNVVNMAKDCGLTYNFDKTVVANTLNAHKLIHLGKKFGVQDQIKEALLEAYFTKGLNVDDQTVLKKIGVDHSIPEKEIEDALTSEAYRKAVSDDIFEARDLGINAVPYFVFNRKVGISGAQGVETFLATLENSLEP